MKYRFIFAVYCFAATLPSIATEFNVEDLNRSEDKQNTWLVLPYVFSTDGMGLNAGAVLLLDGYIQPQMTMVFTAFAGEELDTQYGPNGSPDKARSTGGAYSISGYRPPFSDRLFISSLGSYAYYPNQRLYIDGSNDSKQNLDTSDTNSVSPLHTQGYNNWFNLNFSYVLPWGESKHKALPNIQLSRGLPVNRDDMGGGEVFTTGQTIVGTELFYTRWTADRFIESPALNTNGIRFFLEHDNTDYPHTPSRGYAFQATVSIDFGFGNSTQSWNSLEFDYQHYLALPNLSWTRQSVLALNAWTAYSPSWDNHRTLTPDGVLQKHQTPMWEGASLGGWDRMRAYDSNRFNDKAALYGAAEYRFIPKLNPMADQQWNPFPIDWFQFVFFAEVGRVSDRYNLSFFKGTKYDVGFSVRALAAKTPVRFDIAWGEEGSSMWVMLNQPF
ncbi:BamA/TamA family outer membrane protein [Psychromonas aquatilis]|uniref:BamA/TamA family outer membrane protein n=1 Tax=Psychromonas aquatilis TaxID=2005072 RepID=A0ABU9GTL1_9GAMM